LLIISQNPALYLHVTSTTKEGLDKAIDMINELMQKELPNLVDERRFRRREPEPVERDEYGRVCDNLSETEAKVDPLTLCSVNGQKSAFPSTSNLSPDSTYVPRSSAKAVPTSSTFSRAPVVVFKSRAVALASSRAVLSAKVMSPCSCTWRE
jgi:hypothetical protein